MSGAESADVRGWRVEIRVQPAIQDPLERLLGVLRVRRLAFQHLSYAPPTATRAGLLVIEVDAPPETVERVLAFAQRTVGVTSTARSPLADRSRAVSADQTMALT